MKHPEDVVPRAKPRTIEDLEQLNNLSEVGVTTTEPGEVLCDPDGMPIGVDPSRTEKVDVCLVNLTVAEVDHDVEVENTDVEVATEPDVDQDQDTEPRSEEAKKYRLRLRETEGALTEVQEQLDGIQRQVIGQMVMEECSIFPEVLFAAGTKVSDLIEADVTVNRDAVRMAGDAAATALNVPRGPRKPLPDPNQGRRGGAFPTDNTWAGAFKG